MHDKLKLCSGDVNTWMEECRMSVILTLDPVNAGYSWLIKMLNQTGPLGFVMMLVLLLTVVLIRDLREISDLRPALPLNFHQVYQVQTYNRDNL